MGDSATQSTQSTQLVAADAEPQPCLMIRMLEFTNFKSYANTVKIGPFDRHMTSVVGPNGSGKSNVIDGMLFVFGFKAKQMRQSKVSDLIHSSEAYPDFDFVKVGVHFQNVVDHPDGSYTVVAGSEFSVTREARRDNSSRYWISDKGSNFGEVTTFLRARGIDLDHNRFLILQGEVEQIAMMKPKAPSAHEDGLLEYLEDIIGSNKLVPQIDASLKAMEELNEQRATKLNALKASQQQVSALEPRRQEAERFLATEAQLRGKQSAYYQKNVGEASAHAAAAEEKRDGLAEQLKAEQEKASGKKQELAALEKGYKKKKKEHDKCAEQLDASRKEFQKFEREDIKHREELKAVKGQLKKQQVAIEKETKKLQEAKAELAALQEDVPRLEDEVASVGATQALAQGELEAMYESLKGQSEPIRLKIEACQRKREPDMQALTAIKCEETLAASEKALLEKKVAEGEAERASVKAELDGHDDATKRSRDELKACEAEAKEVASKLAAAEKVVEQAAGKEATLEADERAARAKYDEGKASATSNSARSTQLNGLLAAKRDGRIPGIVGRLGALGSIDAKYDVAASTACGALDHIVVADTAAAQACVSLLRAENLGVATFLILDKQAAQVGAKMDAPFSTPAGSQRLFDLLSIPKDEHRAAFYAAFRDTLVCEDKKKASQIALGGATRHRVVTTDGVVINTSGTMEGGGKPSKGRIGPSAAESADGGGLSEAELAKCLEAADAALQKLEQLKCVSAEAAASVRGLQKDKAKIATQTTKLALQINSADEKKAALEARLARAADAGALGAAEVARQAELDKELKAIGKRLEKAQAKVDEADEQLKELNEQVLAVGGVQLRAKKSRVETLTEQLGSIEGRLAKARAQSESSEKVVGKLTATVKKATDLATELEGKIEATKAAFKTLEDEAMAVMQTYEACQKELADKEEELKGMHEQYEVFKAVVGKARAAEVELEQKLEDCGRELKDAAGHAKHWQAKVDALRESVAKAAEEAPELVGRADEPMPDAEGGEAAAGDAAAALDATHELTADELDALDAAELANEISQLEELLACMTSDLTVIAEYKQRAAEHTERTADFDAVTQQRDAQRLEYERLRKQRLDEFMGGFGVIGMKLKEMYQMITLGGDAELELLDSLDPFSEGIVFSVRPPKKSWKNIANLSGGEKTLSSLALVFALHHYKPTPLYVMDEIDAALDFRNVSIVGNYIKERTRNAQFIIISLRNNMFELADRLVGIYKTHNATKSVAIDPTAFTIAAR